MIAQTADLMGVEQIGLVLIFAKISRSCCRMDESWEMDKKIDYGKVQPLKQDS